MGTTKDKNLRPYAVSLDWLQLNCAAMPGFAPERDTLTHHHVPVGHGSKVFRDIVNVYDSDGCCIGNISFHPYSSAIPANTVIFKAENCVLYEPDPVQRIFEYFAEANLRYKGITRIDIAYDCHEFYGGMKPQNLINNYFSLKYLKVGNNSPWVKMRGGYSLRFRSGNSQKLKMEEEPGQSRKFLAQSVTWGNRSSDIQVQYYNKTTELKEVKMKPHIWEWWKENGLNPDERDVYRVEIRITGLKTVRNNENHAVFKLNAHDIIMQEQIEHLYAAFAAKYFRFYRARDISHIERMPEIRLFSHVQKPLFKPLHNKKKQGYTRGTKILLNWIESHIRANAEEKNMLSLDLESVRTYLIATYGLGQYVSEREEKRKTVFSKALERNDYADIYEFYAQMYAGGDGELYRLAAKAQRETEETNRAIERQLLEEKTISALQRWEDADPSEWWERDYEEEFAYLRRESRAYLERKRRESCQRESPKETISTADIEAENLMRNIEQMEEIKRNIETSLERIRRTRDESGGKAGETRMEKAIERLLEKRKKETCNI